MLARAFSTLLDGSLTKNYPPFYEDSLYLQSYSLDPSNFYAYPLSSADASVNSVSGYFDQVRFLYFEISLFGVFVELSGFVFKLYRMRHNAKAAAPVLLTTTAI